MMKLNCLKGSSFMRLASSLTLKITNLNQKHLHYQRLKVLWKHISYPVWIKKVCSKSSCDHKSILQNQFGSSERYGTMYIDTWICSLNREKECFSFRLWICSCAGRVWVDMLFWDARKHQNTRGIRIFGKSVSRALLFWKTRIQGYAFLEKRIQGYAFLGC